LNEKDKLIKRILNIEKRIWIPMSVSSKEELNENSLDYLKKYLRATEIVMENEKSFVPVQVPCSKCGKYLAKIEEAKGTCFECEGKNWY